MILDPMGSTALDCQGLVFCFRSPPLALKLLSPYFWFEVFTAKREAGKPPMHNKAGHVRVFQHRSSARSADVDMTVIPYRRISGFGSRSKSSALVTDGTPLQIPSRFESPVEFGRAGSDLSK